MVNIPWRTAKETDRQMVELRRDRRTLRKLGAGKLEQAVRA